MPSTRLALAARKPLAVCLLGALALIASGVEAATQTVLNCNDSGAGSLRAAVAAASSGDTIAFDTVSMSCSLITLSTGAITTALDDLTLTGPGAGALTIDAGTTSRVILHQGNGTLALSGLTLQHGGYAALSGGCVSGHTVVLNAVTVKQCRANGNAIVARGGAVFASADLHVKNSTISQSIATPVPSSGGDAFGGGAYAAGNATIDGSTFDVNIGANGGDLFVFGNATITGSTFSNSSATTGGAIEIAGTATIVNSTVGSNNGYYCGGIVSLSNLMLSNSTVAFNSSSSTLYPGREAAGVCAAVAVTMRSSIIAKNTRLGFGGSMTPADLSTTAGTTVAGDTSLVMAAIGTTVPGDTLTVDPQLTSFLNYGGPTKTYGVVSGTPPYGTGSNPLRLASDQRGPGFARMTGEKTDIGAHQSGDGIFANGWE